MQKPSKNLERPLVALVDDETEITQILADDLEADFETIQFNHPKQFLDAIRADSLKPAVLVIDLKMPGLTGLEVLRQLNEWGHQIPTVMFSGYLDKEDAITAMELGVLHLLEKPIDLEYLRTAVSESVTDWELKRVRQQIKEMLSQTKEIISGVRLSVSQFVAPSILDKIFVIHEGHAKVAVDQLLEQLDERLTELLQEENLLVKMKQTQYRKAFEKQSKRVS
ncbi:MAG: hypothetical protein RJB66_1025 [Pseudomonadota bacterium]|jgi:FixJ family two-component response regulator